MELGKAEADGGTIMPHVGLRQLPVAERGPRLTMRTAYSLPFRYLVSMRSRPVVVGDSYPMGISCSSIMLLPLSPLDEIR